MRPDSERRLTERGKQQARVAGLALKRMEVSFDAVLFSPKARARETAELAVEAWDEKARARMREYQALAGGFEAAHALEALSSVGADGRVLLVGHEPDLSRVVAELTGGRVDLKKGGLAVVRLENASGELVILMRPRELALIAGIPGGGD